MTVDAWELDNPIWHALQTRHGAIARGAGGVVRYPSEVAPFLAVAQADADASAAIAALVDANETVYLLGHAPAVSADWSCRAYAHLAQMICTTPLDAVDGPDIIQLSDAHRDDVLALTALVYPHYFRPRTMDLGRYFGIYRDGRLAALIGERLGMDRYQEISAVCTHPDFNGLGYARRLLVFLSNDNLVRGRTPFLHVSFENVRALRLYQQSGYRLRREIGFWSLRRAAEVTPESTG